MTLRAIVPAIYQVRLPLPFALSSVNCYLLRDGDDWTVVDTGLHTEPGAAAWRAAFAELAIAPAQISRIVLTHFHPDHFGMAGWLQQLSGAPVLMAPREIELAGQVWQRPHEEPQLMARFFTQHGMPGEVLDQIVAAVGWLRAATLPHPQLTPLLPGQKLIMGGRNFQAIFAPGHSDSQLIFYCAHDRLMICGDHVLIKISPHVGLWPESEPNPLGRYLTSLTELSACDVALALPGHGPLIEDWPGRISELLYHHDLRLAAMRAAAAQGADAYSIAMQVFDFARFTPHEIRFAVAETIAHLELLVTRGLLRRQAGPIVRYAP